MQRTKRFRHHPGTSEKAAIGKLEPNMLEVLLRIDKRSRYLSLEDEFCVDVMTRMLHTKVVGV